MAEVIDTADHVKHSPTGETWVVGYVRGDKLAACGWPDTLANLSDCTLVKKATGPERLSLLQELARSSGHRASYARERLAASGVRACDPACSGNDSESHCVRTNGPYCGVTNSELTAGVPGTHETKENDRG